MNIWRLSTLVAFIAASNLLHAAPVTQMTITDIDGDGIAGCFKFASLDSGSCGNANRFSSDGSVTGFSDPGNMTVPGASTDGAILFGQAQGIDAFTNGFMFSGFPFKPVTLGAPTGDITNGLLTLSSFPFAGIYQSGTPGILPMSPDPFTLTTTILSDNGGGNFDYLMTWSHLITPEEDPTGSFNGFTAFWRLEGVASVVPVPAAVWLFGSGLVGLVGVARRRKVVCMRKNLQQESGAANQ